VHLPLGVTIISGAKHSGKTSLAWHWLRRETRLCAYSAAPGLGGKSNGRNGVLRGTKFQGLLLANWDQFADELQAADRESGRFRIAFAERAPDHRDDFIDLVTSLQAVPPDAPSNANRLVVAIDEAWAAWPRRKDIPPNLDLLCRSAAHWGICLVFITQYPADLPKDARRAADVLVTLRQEPGPNIDALKERGFGPWAETIPTLKTGEYLLKNRGVTITRHPPARL
jgi:hypothetical protein